MQDCDTSFPHRVERSDKKEIQMIDGKNISGLKRYPD